MEQCFPDPSLICYKRHKNLKDMLIRAKVSRQKRPRRKQLGFKECHISGGACMMCTGNNRRIMEHKCMRTGRTWDITSAIDCNTRNVIYKLLCQRCPNWFYIGETERRPKDRLYQHRSCVHQQKLDTPAGEHFCRPGHSITDLSMLPFERIRPGNDPQVRKIRETLWINSYEAVKYGANKKK